MNVKNLNGMPDHQANLSRTGFDMSQEFAFTSSVGMILPVYQDLLNVGESVYFTGDLITRTQPLVTAAMCDIDVYLDWFFVPTSLLFTLWPSKRWLTNDVISSFYNADSIDDQLPLFNITSYLTHDGVFDYNASPAEWYSSIPQYAQGFECAGKSSFRLANHLGFNPYGIFNGNGGAATAYASADNPNVFPLFALTYQAVFNDYYRLPLDNFVKRQIQSFNVDQYWMHTRVFDDADVSLFALHYRPRHMDYFTGFKVSPLLSVVNSSFASVGDLLSKVDSYLSDFNPELTDDAGSYSNLGSATQVASEVSNNDEKVSSAQLRNMFAVEKLLRITGRAKKDYDSQVLAHFGFKVPHDVKHELTHICQQHCIIHVGEVISTSDTFDGENGSSLGAIGGKGYGVISGNNKKKPYKFTAPVDGVFMCCYSSAPRQRYFGTFDKQNNLVDRMSFYQPEFDKLGMQPLYRYEAFGFSTDDMTERIGWQYRYEQWKRKYNRVSEAFAAPDIYDQKVNNNVSWVNATKPYNTAFSVGQASIDPGTDGDGLFVQPTDINQIMVVPYLPSWDASYNDAAFSMFYTDPFINAFRANVKKVSTMSSFGEPDLNGI